MEVYGGCGANFKKIFRILADRISLHRNIDANILVHHIRARFIARLMKYNAIMIQHSFNLGKDYCDTSDSTGWDWENIEDNYY